MRKQISIYNLLGSFLMLLIGIVFITNPELLIGTISWILGCILIFMGIIRAIYALKNIETSSGPLYLSIMSIIIGIFLISFPNIINVTLKIIFGGWILYMGIQRLIFALIVKSVDNKGSNTYLISSLVIIALGILVLINFYNLIGIFLIIYAALEIINYIYYVIRNYDYSSVINEKPKKVKKKKVPESMKKKKAVDADIEEE